MRLILALFLLASAPLKAESPVETILTDSSDQQGTLQLHLLNHADTPQTVNIPDTLPAILRLPGEEPQKIELTRASSTPASIQVAPQGFARAAYHLPARQIPAEAKLSVPSWTTTPILLAARSVPATQMAMAEPDDVPTVQPLEAAPPPEDRASTNHFLGNFSPYGPVYAVYGPSKNSQARLQFSFKYQLFGSSTRRRKDAGWEQGLYFAYTQRMFWDLGAASSPFRNIDFQPELFYLLPVPHKSDDVALGLQAGIRHESNGRDGPESRSYNTIYVAPMASVLLNPDLYLRISPRFSMRVGKKADNPDIMNYRGNFGLGLDIGNPDGLQLATTTRFNPAKGHGAISADLSYPLSYLIPKSPDVYLFGQGFFGHGENLLDYNRHTARFRVGFAIIR